MFCIHTLYIQWGSVLSHTLHTYSCHCLTCVVEDIWSHRLIQVMHLGKRLTSCLLNTFSRRDYAAAARRDTLIEAERDIMNLLLNERLLQLEEVAQLNRSFNYLVYQLIENGDKNALFG